MKLIPPFNAISVVDAELVKYAQFPGSHCLNGAILPVANGHRFVDEVVSHHYIIAGGHQWNAMQMVSRVFDLDCVTIR